MEKLTVFLLNYNGMAEIKAGSLASVKEAASQISDMEVSVVFLDNFSNDGSVSVVRDYFSEAIVASTFKNEGYDRGTNIGLQLAWKIYKSDYFLLVDSDNFCEPDAYRNLVNYARSHPNAAIVQPMVKSRKYSGKIISCGHVINERGGITSIQDPDGPYDIEHLVSCSISSTLIRSEALKKTGLLNEAFEMYYESSDISFRLREQGYDCACCCEAVAYNERAENDQFRSFRKFYLMRRNLFLLWYLHNQEKYDYYVGLWSSQFETYQEKLGCQAYITDYRMEAERRGLDEGFQLKEHERQNYIKIPTLNGFKKEDVILFYQ